MKTVRNLFLAGFASYLTMCSPVREQQKSINQLNERAREVKVFAQKNGYSTRYCFLLDMRLQSGLNRFFVYDLLRDKLVYSGLVAHGSCDRDLSKKASFSNKPGSGCTSVGIYKVGYSYYGQYGKSYRLHGLQNSNYNAYKRAVVLHGFSCVPEKESYPKPICNSLGCPMVSPAFMKNLSSVIDRSNKPIVLWMYDEPNIQTTRVKKWISALKFWKKTPIKKAPKFEAL